MAEDQRDCSDLLVQIAAVKSALNNVGKIILNDHIDHCVVEAVEDNNMDVLEDLQDAINKFVK
jgi:DNA-binding FrmR family transcriptional regulator